jgi:hypothetical protein
MSTPDAAIVVLYFVVVIGAGFWHRGRAARSERTRSQQALQRIRPPARQTRLRGPMQPVETFLSLALFLCASALAGEWQSFALRDNDTIPVWTVVGPFPNGNPLGHGPGCFGYYTDYLQAVGGEQRCVR